VAGFVAQEDDPVYSLFTSRLDMRKYLKEALAKSTFKSEVECDPSQVDRIIVLSTCAYEFKNARYILITVPVPIG
jgi:sortase B